jgi:2-polyprenyl-3-methyl-5-hydroxy-6-metoxy-1,4-benzoquinol methylase
MKPVCPLCQSQETQERYALQQNSALMICQCQKCSLQFLHPPPSDNELTELYTDAYYQAWGFDRQENRIVEQMKHKTFERRLQVISKFKSHGRILDVGCATGFFLNIAEKFGFESFGIELSKFSGNLASNKFGANKIFIGRMEDYKVTHTYFDVITMFDFLEHIKNPKDIFRKTSTLLKNDGIVVVTTPDTDSFTCKYMKAKWTHYKYEHVLYFNRNTLKQLALQTELEVVEHRMCYKAINLFYLFFQFRTYKHWIFTPLSRIFYSTLPRNLLSYNFYVPMGESVFILQKRKKL